MSVASLSRVEIDFVVDYMVRPPQGLSTVPALPPPPPPPHLHHPKDIDMCQTANTPKLSMHIAHAADAHAGNVVPALGRGLRALCNVVEESRSSGPNGAVLQHNFVDFFVCMFSSVTAI